MGRTAFVAPTERPDPPPPLLSQARLTPAELTAARRVLHGVNQGAPVATLDLPPAARAAAADAGFALTTASFRGAPEQLRPPRVVRVALLQHAHPSSPAAPYADQLAASHARLEAGVAVATAAGSRLICTQELWHTPFFLCTREKTWTEFAEDALTGPSTMLCRRLARQHGVVIISSILERDSVRGPDTVWNTVVVVGPAGNVVGKHRKNHVPRVGDFNESTYYMVRGEKGGRRGVDGGGVRLFPFRPSPLFSLSPQEGNTGHPVFHIPSLVEGGVNIAVNICYGRHHPMNWLAFALNGADIVFNPCATAAGLSEPLWPIEARNAAIACGVYTAAINRVGTEVFPRAFTSGGREAGAPHNDFGHFYGSSYVAAPDGARSDAAPRGADGMVVADCDLNLCRQTRDAWGFQQTARLPLYAALLARASGAGFVPQVVRDTGRDEEQDGPVDGAALDGA